VSATSTTTGLARELAAIVGEQYTIEDPARAAEFAIDEVTPRAIVSPGSADEIAAIMKLANARELVVVPVGGFTHQFAGAVPSRIDIMVRTNRLKALEHYDPGDLMIGVGAGTTLTEIDNVCGQHGQIFPLDAAQPDRCTVGGAVASAVHGPLKHFYGGLRDYCTGIRFVTADGKVAKAGARVVKNVAGYDLMKLMVGSYGTIAILTGASFKLFPKARQTRTFIAAFSDWAGALGFRDRVLASALTPFCLELVSPDAAEVIHGSSHSTETQPWRVIVRAAGSDAVLARYRAELGKDVTREVDGAEESEIWKLIPEFTHRLFEVSKNAMLVRVDVPLQDVGPLLAAAERAAIDNNFVCAVSGRVGVGAMLVGFVTVAVDPPPAMQYVNAISFLRSAMPRDGSAAILRCPVEVKRHCSVWGSTSNDLQTMRSLRQAFDGKDILNRGRFLF
jgi:glycolate oxidase FAD binding subunit